ncbi:RidA family protein [Sinimarinibacterium sp. CAU 1509]|uniref:RidA family protein n=1 Tax=Sinimarinibacterium sp. CAU 1509 TaxID=2562283 RepID=UPI0010AC5A52|nr:RidA family protein [Sinimarinibacterium sp. CAU 1509]TJY55402.1 RidA family protein [Sinimarinibacterium sp. CAU 1509]
MTIESIGQPLRLANGETVPLSAAIRAGDFIFVSGQLGIDDQGRLVAPDIAGQVRQCIERIRGILAQAGAGLDAVIKATAWLTEPSDFAAFNAAYREFFPERPPARSTVVSALLIPGARVEIEAVAYIERPRSRHSAHSRSAH